jgi:hypothetical protein
MLTIQYLALRGLQGLLLGDEFNKASLKLMRKLLKKYGFVAGKLVTDAWYRTLGSIKDAPSRRPAKHAAILRAAPR